MDPWERLKDRNENGTRRIKNDKEYHVLSPQEKLLKTSKNCIKKKKKASKSSQTLVPKVKSYLPPPLLHCTPPHCTKGEAVKSKSVSGAN